MDLYHHFADVYDEIFPVQEKTLAFLTHHFLPGRTLDIGCATGGYLHRLVDASYDAYGLDLDKDMIRVAQEKYPHLIPRLWVQDMRDFDTSKPFQNIYCIGNTLVHLPNVESIYDFLNRIYQSLHFTGTFILQIINYERIISQNITSLPTITTPHATFTRHYKIKEERLIFTTDLVTPTRCHSDETKLIPIRPKMLISLLEKIGFKQIQTFGSFAFDLFFPETSTPLIIVARK